MSGRLLISQSCQHLWCFIMTYFSHLSIWLSRCLSSLQWLGLQSRNTKWEKVSAAASWTSTNEPAGRQKGTRGVTDDVWASRVPCPLRLWSPRMHFWLWPCHFLSCFSLVLSRWLRVSSNRHARGFHTACFSGTFLGESSWTCLCLSRLQPHISHAWNDIFPWWV